jgi:hypothetical protein
MKRSTVVALLALAGLALIMPVPAGAAELSAKSANRVEDPTGDVPYCKGDVTVAIADWTDARLLFQLVTACGMDTNSDPSWVVGETSIGFLIDVNGDNDADFVAVYESGKDGVVNNDEGAVVCSGSAGHSSPTSYSIELPTGCLPSPFTFVGAMIFDENPYGSSCDCPEDDAPDGRFSDPVYRGSPPPPPPLHGQGYWMLGQDDRVYAFGDARIYGTNRHGGRAVDLEPTPSGRGYWIVNDIGSIGVHGDAAQFGAIHPPDMRPSESVTAISRTPSGKGYWIFTNLGRVFPFGDAGRFGDMSATALNGPVLDAIPTPSGQGYYMVASDGGIFTFGDAVFQGSMGDVRLNAPVQSLVPDPDGVGYWLVASDGGIFAFEAEFYGSMGSTKLNKPITGMVGFGKGYLMVGEDGGIFTFGDAPFFGSLGDNPPPVPIVSTAILNQ